MSTLWQVLKGCFYVVVAAIIVGLVSAVIVFGGFILSALSILIGIGLFITIVAWGLFFLIEGDDCDEDP